MLLFLLSSGILESAVSSSPFNYDPFDSLREKNFSDEEFQRCFRHFDSHKYVDILNSNRNFFFFHF
jgi:hypothetical protein